MAPVFADRFYPLRNPVWSLGGRTGRPRPVVPVSLLGPADTWVDVALLDTGADDTVFTEDVARRVGLDLTTAPTGSASGVGMVPAPIRYAEVRLRLTDGQGFHE